MAAFGLLIVGGGLILLYAGFRGVPLVATFQAALAGAPLPQNASQAATQQWATAQGGNPAIPAGQSATRSQLPNFMGPLAG